MSTSSKLLLISVLFFAAILTKITAADSDSSLRIELDQLKSKISVLESSIYERTHELKRKDENIKQLEVIIQDKLTSVASLRNEIQLLQEKGSLGAKEPVGKAHLRAGELEKQVDNLKKEIEIQNTRKDDLEARTNVAEKRIQELNLKLENLQRIRDEQKIRITKIERALQLAEEELMKAKFEATHISEELIEVREAWLPSWLAGHLVHCQSFVVIHWNEHGKPALDVTIQKALEKKAQLANWAEPHIVTIKTKWIPIVTEQWFAFVTNIEPTVQSLTANVVHVYHSSKSTIEPHIIEIQKTVDPYFQEAKKVTKPYVNQVSTVTKPYVDKARTFLKPYTKKAHRGYKKVKRTTTKYHRQVRATIHETLKGNELTKPLATNELVWYMATSLMALPVILLFQTASAMFREKPKKRVRSSHSGSHTRRRHKRVHPEK